jgi:hypothetical protein
MFGSSVIKIIKTHFTRMFNVLNTWKVLQCKFWRRMEKTSWTDRVRNEEVLQSVKEVRNILRVVKGGRNILREVKEGEEYPTCGKKRGEISYVW